MKLWPCGFKIEYTHFALAAAVPLGSEGDPGCIFFTLNTYQATFISDILWYDLKLYSVTDGPTHGRTDRREVWNSYLEEGVATLKVMPHPISFLIHSNRSIFGLSKEVSFLLKCIEELVKTAQKICKSCYYCITWRSGLESDPDPCRKENGPSALQYCVQSFESGTLSPCVEISSKCPNPVFYRRFGFGKSRSGFETLILAKLLPIGMVTK